MEQERSFHQISAMKLRIARLQYFGALSVHREGYIEKKELAHRAAR
jgi:hypothetical protein